MIICCSNGVLVSTYRYIVVPVDAGTIKTIYEICLVNWVFPQNDCSASGADSYPTMYVKQTRINKKRWSYLVRCNILKWWLNTDETAIIYRNMSHNTLSILYSVYFIGENISSVQTQTQFIQADRHILAKI